MFGGGSTLGSENIYEMIFERYRLNVIITCMRKESIEMECLC